MVHLAYACHDCASRPGARSQEHMIALFPPSRDGPKMFGLDWIRKTTPGCFAVGAMAGTGSRQPSSPTCSAFVGRFSPPRLMSWTQFEWLSRSGGSQSSSGFRPTRWRRYRQKCAEGPRRSALSSAGRDSAASTRSTGKAWTVAAHRSHGAGRLSASRRSRPAATPSSAPSAKKVRVALADRRRPPTLALPEVVGRNAADDPNHQFVPGPSDDRRPKNRSARHRTIHASNRNGSNPPARLLRPSIMLAASVWANRPRRTSPQAR